MWNLLNYAAVTVPIGRADRELDSVGNGLDPAWEEHEPRNESDKFNFAQCEFSLMFQGWLCCEMGLIRYR